MKIIFKFFNEILQYYNVIFILITLFLVQT